MKEHRRTILHLGDRFFHTNTSYLLKSTSWLSVGSVFGIGISFFLSFLYARYLTKDLYGDYRYILSIISIAGIFTLPGMNTVITRAVARGFDGTFRNASIIIFLSSFGVTIISIIATVYFYSQGLFSLSSGFLIAAFFIPFIEGMGSWRGFMDGKKEFQKKTYRNIIIQILYGTGMASAILIIHSQNILPIYSLSILIGVYVITHAIPNLFYFIKLIQSIPPNAPQEPNALRYGFHLSLSSLPSTFATYLDGILLFHFLGPSALAVYSFAIAPSEQFKGFLGSFVTAIFPTLSKQTLLKEHISILRKTLPKKLMKASLGIGLLVILYILFIPIFFSLFFPRYMDAVIYSQFFSLSLILFPFGIFGTVLGIEGDPKRVHTHRVTAPLLQIAILIVLVPLFGLWGAIIGRILGRILNHTIAYALFITKK
jgi:O-antigen/teichoic acid export membrane protein